MWKAFRLELYYYYHCFWEIFNLNLTFSGFHKRDSKARSTRIYAGYQQRFFFSSAIMLFRLLRMKGLVTPWLLIATGILIFLNFCLRESASSRQEVSESAHWLATHSCKKLCRFKKYPDLCGRGLNGVTTTPWELYMHQLSDLRC